MTITGTIVDCKLGRGIGWVRSPSLTSDALFRHSDLKGLRFDRSLEGQQVIADIELTPQGLRANNVRRAQEAA